MSILRVGSVGDISPVTHSYNIREITPRKCPIQPVWLGYKHLDAKGAWGNNPFGGIRLRLAILILSMTADCLEG